MDPFPDWKRFVDERMKAGSEDLYFEGLSLMRGQLVRYVLEHVGGDRARAAEILGVSREQLDRMTEDQPEGDAR